MGISLYGEEGDIIPVICREEDHDINRESPFMDPEDGWMPWCDIFELLDDEED